MINFELIFVYGVKKGSNFIRYTLVENQLTIEYRFISVFFKSIPLICISILLQAHTGMCSVLKLGCKSHPTVFVFFMIVLALGLLNFHMNLVSDYQLLQKS